MIYGLRCPQVRPRLLAAPPLRDLLARRARTSRVETWLHDVRLSTRPSTTVLDDLCLHQSVMSHRGSVFDLLLDASWLFRDAGSVHSAHVPSQWPSPRYGIHCQTVCKSGC